MSLIPAEFLERVPRSLRRALSLTRNVLAVFGVLLFVVVFAIFSMGSEMTRDMDSRARRALGKLIFSVQDRDLASAMLTRAPLAAGVSHADAERAIRRRAREIDLEVQQAQRYPLTGAGGDGKGAITVTGFCGKKTLDALLALRPELGALLPCSIVLVTDPDRGSWVATLNMELLMYGGQPRDKTLETRLLSLKDRLLDVMAAAAAVPVAKPSED
jgi:hypothetical protein